MNFWDPVGLQALCLSIVAQLRLHAAGKGERRAHPAQRPQIVRVAAAEGHVRRWGGQKPGCSPLQASRGGSITDVEKDVAASSLRL